MVSIDRVYQTVLTIVNKEGMDYITPQEFNLLANQAQIEVFEEYFQDQTRAMLQYGDDGDYSDSVRNLEEKITFFDNTMVVTENDNDVFEYPSNFYRLGRVTLTTQGGLPIIVDEISHKAVSYVQLSPLTAPTRTQPVYTRHEGGIVIYPTVLMDTDMVRMIYVRRPVDVAWRGSNMNGQFVQGGSTDFELHPSEFPELVVKILGYIGLLIKQQDVQAFAQQQEIGIEQNEQ